MCITTSTLFRVDRYTDLVSKLENYNVHDTNRARAIN